MGSSRHALLSCAIAALMSVSLGGTAAAQQVDDATRASARQLGEEGNALFDAGDWAGALDRYDRAAKLVSVPTLGLKAARALEKLGRLVEASERYLAVTRMKLAADALPVHKQALADAETERAALLPRIPALVIQLEGGTAEVFLDGQPLPPALIGAKRAVDPGAHRVEARTAAGTVATKDVQLKEGETLPVTLSLPAGSAAPVVAPAPPPPSGGAAPPPPAGDAPSDGSTQRILGFAAVGLGVVGVGLGMTFGLIAAGDKSDLEAEDKCGPDLACPPALHDEADSYNSKRTLSTVGLIAGGVAAAAGVTLILTAPSGDASKSGRRSPERSPHVGAVVGPTWLGVTGAF